MLMTHRCRVFDYWPYRNLTPIMREVLHSYGKVEVYYSAAWDEHLFVPWWLGWLRPTLRWRDWMVEDWARFLYDLGIIGLHDRVPWPEWLTLGWSGGSHE